MKHNFKVGDKVKMKDEGPIRSNCNKSCCRCLQGKDLTVIEIIADYKDNGRIIKVGYGIPTYESRDGFESRCTVHPDDIIPIKINWRERLNEKV